MAFPHLSDDDVSRLCGEVAAYVAAQRRRFREESAPLGSAERAALQAFFASSVLDSVRVRVLSGDTLDNPSFYRDLVQLGFAPEMLPDFTQMAAVTFVDTVVSQEAFTGTILFHELVHVVQYAELGVEEFARLYVLGFLSGGSYRAIPLERNAYDLEARFSNSPSQAFSVAAEVQRWVEDGRFGAAEGRSPA